MDMIIKWRTKPVVIEALEYTGDNINEIKEFVDAGILVEVSRGVYSIRTFQGNSMINKGDYIIKGYRGEFYPCNPDTFHTKYERHLVWDENI